MIQDIIEQTAHLHRQLKMLAEMNFPLEGPLACECSAISQHIQTLLAELANASLAYQSKVLVSEMAKKQKERHN